jgi:hypothetical protein
MGNGVHRSCPLKPLKRPYAPRALACWRRRALPQPVRKEMTDPFYEQTDVPAREDIAHMVTRPRHSGIGELWTMPTEQL